MAKQKFWTIAWVTSGRNNVQFVCVFYFLQRKEWIETIKKMEQARFWVGFLSLTIDKTPCLHGNCCRCRFLSQIDVWCLFLSVHFFLFLLFIEFNSMSIRGGGWVEGRAGFKVVPLCFSLPSFRRRNIFPFYWVSFLLLSSYCTSMIFTSPLRYLPFAYLLTILV